MKQTAAAVHASRRRLGFMVESFLKDAIGADVPLEALPELRRALMAALDAAMQHPPAKPAPRPRRSRR